MKLNFNKDWEFLEKEEWKKISIPHTPKIEELDVGMHYQGISKYRKSFILPKGSENKQVLIELEAVMQKATIYLNEKCITVHEGGYLPIIVDISKIAYAKDVNVLEVVSDNTDDCDIPPGKPLNKLDFCYFGGIYRNTYLHIKDYLSITNEILADKVAGGGVFVTYKNVSEKSAIVNIKTDIQNLYSEDKKISVVYTIDDKSYIISDEIKSQNCKVVENNIEVHNPKLWSFKNPNLYNLKIEIYENDKLRDCEELNIGIRSIKLDFEKGFLLNGKKIMLRGVNRHQQFPYVGNAVSDNAHIREMIKYKNGGFNCIRLGHYPQSKAFLDAGDRLGMILIEPTPGWQWCKDGKFKENVKKNIREMIRRDRNHPAIMIWELSLNETGDTDGSIFDSWSGATDEFFIECKNIAKLELPDLICSGDTFGRKDAQRVNYNIAHSCFDATQMCRIMPLENKLGFDREYGDFEFGGNYSTTRQTRADGEYAMLLATWNFMWSHNKNRSHSWCVGDAIWVGADYNRGYFPEAPICTCGVMDLFRLEKTAYYFYQSQQSEKYVIHIANYWQNDCDKKKIVVFSNCDEVELLINGEVVARQNKDNGADSMYDVICAYADPNYWIKQTQIEQAQNKTQYTTNAKTSYFENKMYDGGNCKHLENPPFTFFDIPFYEGKIEAIGIKNGTPVAHHERNTYKTPKGLEIFIDDCNVELISDDNDFVFVHCMVVDENNNIVYNADNLISFTIENGRIIGNSQMNAVAGIASIMIKAKSENVKISVTSDGLNSNEIEMKGRD